MASLIQAMGHDVHTPTIKGNRPGDSKTTGLTEAIESIVEYLENTDLEDVILVGHSYGRILVKFESLLLIQKAVQPGTTGLTDENDIAELDEAAVTAAACA